MKMMVFANAVEGRDAEFNTWYDTVHLPEVTAVPGVKSGERFKVVAPEGQTPDHRYLAVYDIEGPQAAAEVGARSADGRMSMTDTLDLTTVKVVLWEPM